MSIWQISWNPEVSEFQRTLPYIVLVPCHEREFAFFEFSDSWFDRMCIAPADIASHGQVDFSVVGKVRVVNDEVVDAGEDTFDWIEPRGIGRRVDQGYVAVSSPLNDFGFLVRGPVVENDIESQVLRVPSADVFEEFEHLLPSFALVAAHEQAVILEVVGR